MESAAVKSRAFSLIELMVAIAIVAILSAVAVPAYKAYEVKSRFSKMIPVINNLIAKSVSFSQTQTTNLRFGNAYDIGVATTNPNVTWQSSISNPASLFNGYSFTAAEIGDYSVNTGSFATNCGAVGILNLRPTPASMGLSTAEVDTVTIWVFYWHGPDKTFHTKYFYSLSLGSANLPGYSIPGWTNLHSTTVMNYDNYNAYWTSTMSSAVCQP